MVEDVIWGYMWKKNKFWELHEKKNHKKTTTIHNQIQQKQTNANTELGDRRFLWREPYGAIKIIHMRIKEDLDYERYTKCRIDLWAIFETEFIELCEWLRASSKDKISMVLNILTWKAILQGNREAIERIHL